MAGITNRGKYLMLESYFTNTGTPATLYVALCTSASVPSVSTATLGTLSEVAAGNGYTSGGQAIPRSSVGFSAAEIDASNTANVTLNDVTFAAVGGSITFRYVVLTDDNATLANRQVIAYWDLGSDQTIAAGRSATVSGAQIEMIEG